MVREAVASVRSARFEPVITLGSVLTLLGMLAAGFAAFYGQSEKLATVAQRMYVIEKLADRFDRDHDTLTDLKARIDRRTQLEDGALVK